MWTSLDYGRRMRRVLICLAIGCGGGDKSEPPIATKPVVTSIAADAAIAPDKPVAAIAPILDAPENLNYASVSGVAVGITVRDGTDAAKGRAAVVHLLEHCTKASSEKSLSDWKSARTANVERHSIYTKGKDLMIWDISIHFADFDDVLWYQVTENLASINPTKDIAGQMCGGIPRDTFSKF